MSSFYFLDMTSSFYMYWNTAKSIEVGILMKRYSEVQSYYKLKYATQDDLWFCVFVCNLFVTCVCQCTEFDIIYTGTEFDLDISAGVTCQAESAYSLRST